MVTVLAIVLAVLIVVCVWFIIGAVKYDKEAKRRLQERMDEYDEEVGKLTNETGMLRQHLDETIAQLTRQKGMFEDLKEKYDALWKDYQKLEAIHGDPHASHQDPVNGGEPSVNTEPGDPVNKKAAKKAKKAYPKKSQK